ncbi:MAG: hypothetical protein QM726_14195 [Chitinophagaceae bacterium]
MKYLAVLSLLVLFTCGCGSNETITRLLAEQKSLKDSTYIIHEKIGRYIRNGIHDSAELQSKQLGKVQARLIEIQTSIDRFEKK